ncbi:hypothetical protein JMJ77_0014526, partial [Colletotrichum scovillei]
MPRSPDRCLGSRSKFLAGRPVGRLAEKGVACLPSNSRHRPLMGPRG